MVLLDESAMTALQLQSHYHIYRKKLIAIDYRRYRGLGEENVCLFITHGTQYCREAKIPTVRDTAYIIYMMSMIGSFFYEDLRYLHIHRILQDNESETPARFNRVSRVFSAFMASYAGEDGERYRQALTSYRNEIEHLPHSITHEETIAIWAACIGMKDPRNIKALQRVFPNHAAHAAKVLGVPNPDGERLCLSLSLWLGVGFYKDPLYPWVRDVPEKERSERAKTLALNNYTAKRLDHQLRTWGDK